MKTATLKTLEQTDNVSLYSICFNGDAISEYEAFVRKFKEDAKLNSEYKTILLAIEKIVAVGAFERRGSFRKSRWHSRCCKVP